MGETAGREHGIVTRSAEVKIIETFECFRLHLVLQLHLRFYCIVYSHTRMIASWTHSFAFIE